MKFNRLSYISAILVAAGSLCWSCSDEVSLPDGEAAGRTAMTFTFSHPSAGGRATETAFERGDVVGLFVAEGDKVLEIAGNTVNNEAMTFNGTSWTSAHQLYWDAGTYNAYAYYPRTSDISSISDLPFEVNTDQSGNATPDAYEASDLLYASAKGLTASNSPVALQFGHIMSKISICLIKGEDFEGDMPEHATVYIHNTVTTATVDLAAGIVTKNARGERKTIVAHRDDATTYSAIVVPQRMENRMPLIEVVMNGVSFLYESKFLFKPGIHHIVNLVVDKNPEQVKIEVGGEITDWN